MELGFFCFVQSFRLTVVAVASGQYIIIPQFPLVHSSLLASRSNQRNSLFVVRFGAKQTQLGHEGSVPVREILSSSNACNLVDC